MKPKNLDAAVPDASFSGSANRSPLEPADALIAWLDKQVIDGEAKLVRLPAHLGQGDMGYTNRGAKIGALTARLDDSKLGIGIAGKARACAGKPRCAMLVDGYWRGKDDAGDYTFEVIKIVKIMDDAETDATTYAEVEVPGPNAN